MEKNGHQKHPVKWIFLFLFLTGLFTGTSRAQLRRVKGYCGMYYSSMEQLYRQKQAELDFYDFRPGQVIASIGAQCGTWEAAFAAAKDSLLFYLEDIDTTYFNKRQLDFAWRYYDSLRGQPMKSGYKMVLGNEQGTGLPDGFFDKITVINSFHEFSHPGAMLQDLRRKLKPGATLYIDESIPKKQGDLHGICKMPMLTPDEMNRVLSANGFRLIEVKEMQYRKSRPVRAIYACQVK